MSAETALLFVEDLEVLKDNGTPLFTSLSFQVTEGDVLVLRGPSGSGKSTLLKCIAELNLYSKGTIRSCGRSVRDLGGPLWRVKVAYVPQRPSILPGTPLSFLDRIRTFSARQGGSSRETEGGEYGSRGDRERETDPLELAQEWGVDKTLWQRDWTTLSGGEAQRIALAVAVGVGGADILLLDEPTSALDEVSSKKVETSLLEMLPEPKGSTRPNGRGTTRRGSPSGAGPKALIWITHSSDQAERVGTRTLDLSAY
ncbi:hypothetical protein IAU60_000507 [Kwoniella sp. DSM 27419]